MTSSLYFYHFFDVLLFFRSKHLFFSQIISVNELNNPKTATILPFLIFTPPHTDFYYATSSMQQICFADDSDTEISLSTHPWFDIHLRFIWILLLSIECCRVLICITVFTEEYYSALQATKWTLAKLQRNHGIPFITKFANPFALLNVYTFRKKARHVSTTMRTPVTTCSDNNQFNLLRLLFDKSIAWP